MMAKGRLLRQHRRFFEPHQPAQPFQPLIVGQIGQLVDAQQAPIFGLQIVVLENLLDVPRIVLASPVDRISRTR